MKSAAFEIKRRVRRDAVCINTTLTVIFIAAAIVLGILFAVNGVDKELYCSLVFPACALSPFFMVLFFALALSALAFSASAVCSSPLRPVKRRTYGYFILYIGIFSLSYVWIPLTYKAEAFFASSPVCAAVIAALAVLYPAVKRVSGIASVGVFVFAVWQAYLLYLSFSLFLVN